MKKDNEILKNVRDMRTGKVTPAELIARGGNGKLITQTLSIAEAGEVLGISRLAAYKAVKNGQIPSIRIGRRILIPVTQLTAMLAGEK